MKTMNEYKQNRGLLICFISVALTLTACQEKDSAEKAGQNIDRAVDKTGQTIQKQSDKASQKIEAVKDSVERKADQAGEQINQSADATKGALEKAGQNIDHAAEQAGKNIEQTTEKAGKQLEAAKEAVIDKAETAGDYIDDSVITTKIKTAILNDPLLKSSQIEVTTVQGVVTLTGTVDSEQIVGRVIGLANVEKNVKAVKSDLLIRSTTPSKQ